MPASILKTDDGLQPMVIPQEKRVSMAAPAQLATATTPEQSQRGLSKSAAAEAGNGDKKKKKKVALRKNSSKMRVHLPTIESYERELEFPADAPGRVVVRLERLMGTDRVRITDARYMGTLLRRLEEDEQVQWIRRSKMRKQAERNRYRQLAIEGHMEPGPDMMDLYNHPVFRVNRILNRLSKLDNEISASAVMSKPPPLTPVEPFEEYDRTGILFGFHPGHYKLTVPEDTPELKTETDETEEEVDEVFTAKYMKESAKTAQSSTSLSQSQSDTGVSLSQLKMHKLQKVKPQRRQEEWDGEGYSEEEPEVDESELEPTEEEKPIETNDEDMEDEDFEDEDFEDDDEEEEGDEAGPSRKSDVNCEIELLRKLSLGSSKKKFGIRREVDLEKMWSPYRSPLVDRVYDEANEGATEMFSTARELLQTYQREVKTAEAFYTKYNRMFR